MKCPVCGSGNPHEAQFCSSCGAPCKLVARSTWELVQETFRVYRTSFRSFLLIALVANAPAIPLAFVSGNEITVAVITLYAFSLVLSALAGGAMVCAVSQQYLGSPIKAMECYGRAWARVLSLVLSTAAFFLAIFGAVAPSLVLSTATAPALVAVSAFATIIGMPLVIYLAVSWFFFYQCIMLERKGPLASLWHSRELVKGRFWRILGIGAVFTAIGIPGILAASLVFEVMSPVLGALVYAAVITALVPIIWIGATLAYYDLRIRKDNYSIENLAQEMGEA